MTFLGTLGRVAALLAIAAGMAAADSLTVQRDDRPSAIAARGIATADFNRDGWIDLVTAHNDPDGLSIQINRGRGGGYTQSFIALPGGPFDVVTGDLNKDGNPDIAVANPDANLINVLYGLGDGTFRTPLNVGGRFNPRSLTIADMDRDGNPDIVFTEYNNASVTIYWGDGVQSFIHRQPGSLNVGTNPQGVAVADFNVDGWPDLVVANSTSGGLTIWYQTPGANTFSRRDLDVPQQQNVVTTGDFDRDGRPDVAAASTGTSDVTVWLNGRTAPKTLIYPSGGTSPRGIVAADLNRDGALDLITANRGTSTLQVLTNAGDGTFGPAAGYAAGTGSRVVAAGDFDNDGRVDLASGNEYTPAMTVLSNTTALPRGGFGFTSSLLGPHDGVIGNTTRVDTADFDLDGRIDTAVSSGIVFVHLADGRVVQLPSTAEDDSGFAVAHTNADAYPDIVVIVGPFQGAKRIEAYQNDGHANFSDRRVTQTGLDASDIQAADFNRDGKTDVVLLGTSSIGAKQFQIYLGAGDGTFQLASSTTVPNAFSVAIGDLNRDGAPDVVTQNNRLSADSMAVVSFINDGTGRFSAGPTATVTAFDTLYGGTIADVNHDGYGDYAAAGTRFSSQPTETRMILLLGGPSGFTSQLLFRAPETALSTLIADFDVDGNPDVMSDTGLLFRGRGDGTFEPLEMFDFFVPGAKVVDVNRDGLPDIVGPEELWTIKLLISQRGDANTPPAVTLGPDGTAEYAAQFYTEDPTELFASVTDAETHRATFHWIYPDGRTADTGVSPFLALPTLDPGRYEFIVEAHDGRGGIGRDTIVITVTPTKEIVIHPGAQPDTFPKGNWTIASDPSAAEGVVVRDVSAGAPKVTSPLANPASRVDIGFAADPTQTYKLWVRLKADSDNAANDSVWLQFTNAVDASGRSFAPGTTSGIEVVLEECSGCGDSKWGWRDEAWGQRNMIGTLTLRFTKGGWQNLRLQTREDGVSIDQIVLSSEQYLTTRPGAVKDDATILPRRF